jgi:hypothetical protein
LIHRHRVNGSEGIAAHAHIKLHSCISPFKKKSACPNSEAFTVCCLLWSKKTCLGGAKTPRAKQIWLVFSICTATDCEICGDNGSPWLLFQGCKRSAWVGGEFLKCLIMFKTIQHSFMQARRFWLRNFLRLHVRQLPAEKLYIQELKIRCRITFLHFINQTPPQENMAASSKGEADTVHLLQSANQEFAERIKALECKYRPFMSVSGSSLAPISHRQTTKNTFRGHVPHSDAVRAARTRTHAASCSLCRFWYG